MVVAFGFLSTTPFFLMMKGMIKNRKTSTFRVLPLFVAGLVSLLMSGRIYAQRTLQLDMQAHGNFSELLYGRGAGIVQGLPLSTFTLEGTGLDKIGSTYFFIDLEVGNANVFSDKMLGGTYIEFTREWCFWRKSRLSGLSVHTEFDAGVGYGGDSWGSRANGWDFKTALLGGLSYTWLDPGKWMVQLQLLNRYTLKDRYGNGGEGFQMTLVWQYDPVKWFTFSGYGDFFANPEGGRLGPEAFHVVVEPYCWFNITGYLAVGTRIRTSYNFYKDCGTYDRRFYCAPTIGLKWIMN